MSDYRRGGEGRGVRDMERPEMHQAVCDDCGRECQVPFKPTGSKPIYCSNCFEKRGNEHTPSRSYERHDSRGGGSSDVSAQLDEINSKLDQILRSMQPRFPSSRDSAPRRTYGGRK